MKYIWPCTKILLCLLGSKFAIKLDTFLSVLSLKACKTKTTLKTFREDTGDLWQQSFNITFNFLRVIVFFINSYVDFYDSSICCFIHEENFMPYRYTGCSINFLNYPTVPNHNLMKKLTSSTLIPLFVCRDDWSECWLLKRFRWQMEKTKWYERLFGKKLIKCDSVDGSNGFDLISTNETLQDTNTIGIYFSFANINLQSDEVIKKLRDLYDRLRNENCGDAGKFEVVQVVMWAHNDNYGDFESSHRDSLQGLPWLAMPYSEIVLKVCGRNYHFLHTPSS